jgi:hypothetical protein
VIYLVNRMHLAPRARRDLKSFWAWLEERERWFYRDLPMVRGVRWFMTSVGDLYTLEVWAGFDDMAGFAAYRAAVDTQKTDARWESERVTQDDWWEFLDSRLMSDIPCRVGFGQIGETSSSHSPAAPTTRPGAPE